MDTKHTECYLDIIKIITQKNPAALYEMKQCLDYTKGFYNTHKERYADRDMVWEDYEKNKNRFLWISMVDILIFHGYLFEIDWKDLLDDILPELNNIAIKKNYSFEILPFLKYLVSQKKGHFHKAGSIDFSLIPPNPTESLLQKTIDIIHNIYSATSKNGDLTGEILYELTNYLRIQDQSLVCLEIGSDCYDLTIIESNEYNRLFETAATLGQTVTCSYSF